MLATKHTSQAKAILQKLHGGPLSFGQLIGSIRICNEVSQAELARKLKISGTKIFILSKCFFYRKMKTNKYADMGIE